MSARRDTPGVSRRGFLTAATAATAGLGARGLGGPGAAAAALRSPSTGANGWGRPPAPPPKALRPGGAFDQLLAQMAARDQFSGTALLTYRGRPVLARAYGMADKQAQLPNRIDTIFALASVTKLFTATAVIQLVEQGKIELYETLGTYLDGFPAQVADTVTVHQLLTHTSGMGDFTQSSIFKQDSGTWSSPAEMMDGIMRIIVQSPLLFTPGTRGSYSNSGYATLGALVGQVSGGSYAHYYDYVREEVFARAGMSRSDFYTNPQRLSDPEIAHNYALQPDGSRADATGQGAFMGNPAGNAFSTAPDMVRFARALLGDQLLGDAWTQLMNSPKYPNPPMPAAHALPGTQNMTGCYGTIGEIFNSQRILSISGSGQGGGVTATIDMYPDLDWDAVMLSNYDSVDLSSLTNAERQPITRQAG